jgi:PAS domain S-box-containing protein
MIPRADAGLATGGPAAQVDDALRVGVALEAADIVGIWDGDLIDGRVYGDSNFARIYGVDPVLAARGVPRGGYFKQIHPDDIPAVRADMDRLFAGAADYSNEHRILRPDGAIRWVLTRGRLVRDADGQPTRFAGVSVDITERRLAEARQAFLLDLSDRLRELADPQAIMQTAVVRLGQFLGANRVGYGKVHGDDSTVEIETCYADGLPPTTGVFPLAAFGADNIARHRQGLTIVHEDVAALPVHDTPEFPSRGVRGLVSVPLIRGGRLRATLFVSQREPRIWAQGDVRLIEGVAGRLWDAIERTRAEESLRRLNASLEEQVQTRTRERDRTWELAPTLMAVAAADGTLLAVNPAWTRALGWTQAETIGRNAMDFVAPEGRDAGAAGMALLFDGLPVIETQLSFLTKTGERRQIVWTTVPEGGQLYGYGRDVTDQVVAEERLRQAQKMEAVGQLTGGLAHDFNNLLTGILGSLELLQSRVEQGRFTGLAGYIELGQGAARRAAALTHRLLAFSRRQTLDPKATEVNHLVAGMEELVRRTVGPAMTVTVALAATHCVALVDPHQLENALLNLCINARDAMPDGGHLAIETAVETVTEAAADLGLVPGPYLVLRVTDTGTGMTPEVMRRAFDPFFTTKPLGAGTGLGLSMIYGFARQSGGTAHIQSELGRGTTVSIFMPQLVGEDRPSHPIPTAAAALDAGRGETVLVVDDEPTVRVLVGGVLDHLGYAAIEAADGASGLRVLESDARIDLLVTDVGLPGGLNGRQLAEAGRALRPGLRVLFITGYAEHAVLDSGALDDGMQILTKPFALDVLASRIRQLISVGRLTTT